MTFHLIGVPGGNFVIAFVRVAMSSSDQVLSTTTFAASTFYFFSSSAALAAAICSGVIVKASTHSLKAAILPS